MNESNIDIVFVVIAATAGMLLLITSFLVITVMNQKRKAQLQQDLGKLKEQQQNMLIESAVRSEEIERHRIAELLHDEVGALLSSSRIFLVEMNTRFLSAENKQDHAKVKELIDESIKKVRNISHNLHSTILKEFGLNEAIRDFMKKITGGTSIQSVVELDDEFKVSSAEKDLGIYRIIQELANNIIKHAHPKNIEIKSSIENNFLHITIHHNGNGLSQEEFEELRYKSEGLGLKNIQNRIILLKGQIRFEKPSANDSYIHLNIPVQL